MRVRNLSEIQDRFRAHCAEMNADGVLRLPRFGFFLSGSPRDDSDVDLLVELAADNKTFDRFLALAARLQGILERPVGPLTPESLATPLGRSILASVVTFQLSGKVSRPPRINRGPEHQEEAVPKNP